MSLVTTCPACATSFLLKPEHLAAHRGDVRCGQCDFVFNALDKLGETVAPEIIKTTENREPLAESISENQNITEPNTEDESEITKAGVIAESEIKSPEIAAPQAPVQTEPNRDIKPEAAPETPAIRVYDAPFDISTFDISPYDETSLKPAETSLSEQRNYAFEQTDFSLPDSTAETRISDTPIALAHADLVDYRIEPAIAVKVVDVEPEKSSYIAVADKAISAAKAYDESSSFIDRISKVDKSSPKKSKLSKWLSILLAMLLVIAALAQTTYYLRTQLSTTLPGLKPYLVKACAKLGCVVELPKNIKLLVIDDSSIEEDSEHENVVHLSSTLINNAEFAQAYPMLELTLTDANNAPALRRTFKPSEYLTPGTKIADGIPAGEELHINLALTTNGQKVSGYRVQVSY